MKQGVEIRATGQRLGFGVSTLEPLPDLVDSEAVLAVAQTQTRQCPDPEPQSTLRRHPTRIEFLPGGYGGGTAHGGGELQQSLVPERLTAERLGRLAHFVEFLEDPQGWEQRVGRRQAVGLASEFLGECRQFLGARHDDLPGDPSDLESRDCHRGLGFHGRPGDDGSHALLSGRIGCCGGGSEEDRQIEDLGDRDNASQTLHLLAQFVAKRRDGGVLAPPVAVERQDLADPGTGDVQGVSDVGLAGPVIRRLSRGPFHGEQGVADAPLGLLLRDLDPDDPVMQAFQVGRPRWLVGRLLLAYRRLDAGEPPPQFAEEVDDFSAGLVADTTHQVEVADGILQQVADGQDVGPFQSVLGTDAQTQGGDGGAQVRLIQPDPQIDLLTAGCLDLALFRFLEDLLPRPPHLVSVVEPFGRVPIECLAEKGDQSLPDAEVKLLCIEDEVAVGHRRVRLAVAPFWQNPRPEGHLVERHGRRIPLRMQVPPLRLAIGEERVPVIGSAHLDVVERGLGQ